MSHAHTHTHLIPQESYAIRYRSPQSVGVCVGVRERGSSGAASKAQSGRTGGHLSGVGTSPPANHSHTV